MEETKYTLTQQLDELARDCAEPNWDGYDAVPVSQTALQFARRLIPHINSICFEGKVEEPEVSAAPDGSVIYEWICNDKRLALMVDTDGSVDYAFIYGDNNSRSFENLKDGVI